MIVVCFHLLSSQREAKIRVAPPTSLEMGINEMVRRRVDYNSAVHTRRIIAMHIASIGIDLGKTTFHLVALGEHNKIYCARILTHAVAGLHRQPTRFAGRS
jgi:hypothetical protein